jgi:hypothetical protein
MDWIIGRRDAAVRHDLDELRAGLDLLARRLAHPVDSVHEARDRADAGEKNLPVVRPRAAVAVPAGLAQRLAANDEARPVDQPLVEGSHEAVISAAEIAHGGEAAHQNRPHDARGAQRRQRRRLHGVGGEIDEARHHVHVTVDHAGHQRLAREIDPRRARRRDRPVGDLLDAVVLHQDFEPIQERVVVRVEQAAA